MSKNNERFRKMIDSSQDWFWEFDENANFTYASPVIKDLLGFEPEDLIGLNAFDLMAPEEADRVRKHFDPIAKKFLPFNNLENTNLHKDGHEVVIESSGTPFFDEEGKFRGYRGIDRDITSRKKIEADLRQAKLNAETASRVKSIFLANMSHELRTPMVGIKGFIELLGKTELSPEQNELLAIIASSTETMMALVDNILDIIKIEAGELKIITETFNLSNLINQIIQPLAPKISEKGLSLTAKIPDNLPEMLVGDPIRIKQILLNLFDNAIKFTEKGDIILTVSLKEPCEESVTVDISLKDTGCGIPAELHEGIFEQFVQGDETMNRNFGGSGLGLTISRRLAKMMGGDIVLTSQEGLGSKFTLQLSLKK